MNKQEYMDALREALIGFNDEFADDVIRDYEEHFAVSLKAGRSEDDICRELGDIEEAVYELKNEYVDYKKREISKKEEEEFREKGKDTQSKEDFHDEKSKPEDGFQEKQKEYTRLEVDMIAEDIELCTSRDGSFHADYDGDEDKLQIERRGGIVRVTAKRYDNDGMNISFLGLNLFHIPGSMSGRVRIEVPERYDLIQAKTVSGDILVRNLRSDEMFFSTTSGELRMENTDSRHLVAKLTSGDVEVSDSSIKKADLRSMSGDVHLYRGKFGAVKMESMSGDIDSERAEFKKLFSSSKSGDVSIRMREHKGMAVRVSSITGDGSILYGNENFRICGSFERIFGDGDCQVDVKTISGDVRIL